MSNQAVGSTANNNNDWQGGYLIGTDTGGTFTDCVIAGPHGLSIGKALSTPGELWQGILDSITDAAKSIGGLDHVLHKTSVLAHGTTAMLNATLTGEGATVGIITTVGFEDTLAIGRVNQKVAGLAEWEMIDVSKLQKSQLFCDKQLTIGLHERINSQGEVLKAIDPEEVKRVGALLKERGATSFAVNLLWSCANDEHEQIVAQILRETFPEIRVSCSSELASTVGEYERFTTCALNAYIVDIADSYLGALEKKLEQRGFEGRLLVTRAWGDLEQAERVAKRAVPSLFSGPIGGVVGAKGMTQQALEELPVILCADLGGTSLDVAVIHSGKVHWNRHPVIERLQLAVPTFEVASIGIGGGSIAYCDDLGLVHVGPRSAGSVPGPACYQNGGEQPTLTDAALLAGWLPQGSRMPGGIELSVEHAAEAMQIAVAEGAKMTVDKAATSVLRIACAQMADLIRKSCIERAVDPRTAVPLVYGGAGAQYAGALCNELGVKRFLVPELASGFSALGMLGANEGNVLTRSMHQALPIEPETLEQAYLNMQQSMSNDLRGDDENGDHNIEFERFAELRYNQQKTELRVELPPKIDESLDLGKLFIEAYEQRYGKGASDASNQIELTAVVVRASRKLTSEQPLSQRVPHDGGIKVVESKNRMLWLNGQEYEAPVISFAPLRAGNVIQGPAIISENYTSVVVPPHWQAQWRDDLNMLEVSSNDK